LPLIRRFVALLFWDYSLQES